jgi:RNA polymerase sigma-70 factor (ECF subfamily)
MDARSPHPGAGSRWDWQQLRRECLREAQSVLGATQSAEDAAQEAVFRAWRHRAACRTPADPAPWIRSIARREAVRLAGSQPELPVERVADVADPESLPSPETVAATRVRRLVAGLPATDRQLLYLQHWQDVPVAEIASRMQLPVGTVKVRLHRARIRLRQSLEEVEQ